MDDLCNSAVDNDDAVIPRIQEMLHDQPGLDQNSATAVVVTKLLLPVMAMTNKSMYKRLASQETAIT